MKLSENPDFVALSLLQVATVANLTSFLLAITSGDETLAVVARRHLIDGLRQTVAEAKQTIANFEDAFAAELARAREREAMSPGLELVEATSAGLEPLRIAVDHLRAMIGIVDTFAGAELAEEPTT